MATYHVPIEDIRFVLNEVIDIKQLNKIEKFEHVTSDLIDAILEEATKLCENEIFPLNLSGDQEGCHYENGVVRTPKGFKEAYDLFVEGGWQSLSCDEKWGGQGMPRIIDVVLSEILCSANISFSMYPMLTHGAYEALKNHGTEELKQAYMPKLTEGSWTGTMCLTEPHCGTDLRLLSTKAVPQDDGSYKITGTKIFISAGEHDLSDNIIHLVIARTPDAPEGIRGISMFIVPKFIPNDGEAGPRNGVKCGSIEHKMGIKASSTCVMNFDDATGWLVGPLHEGMNCMFTMMNAARLGVGMQGLALAETAYQSAADYAKERLQGRSLSGVKAPDKIADPIIVHPDVRKMLLSMKSFTEGARALAYTVGISLDLAEDHPDETRREEADDFVQLLTPVVKSMLTDFGSEVANTAVQVYGGHGFIAEHGVEQIVRDVRITQIYEGTNGIQALDLVGRKLGMHSGRYLRRFFHPIDEFVKEHANNPELAEFVKPLKANFDRLQKATMTVAQRGMMDKEEAGAAATDYLNLFGLVAVGFMWAKMAKTALGKLDSDNRSFYEAKIATARFYMARVMPKCSYHFAAMMSGKKTLMEHAEESF
jgi:3-(methylsulfanyl)propanoyl-CoA dehydrogenase